MTFDQLKELLDRYGIAAVMLGWFAFRAEAILRRLISKINRLIIAVMLILRTLRLAEEEEALMEAISDDGDSGKTRSP